jgi:hypothetical protein
MNNYSKKQFDGCAFNPLTEGKMLQEYPRLSEIVSPEWMDENTDGILRFVVMVYDPSSPLIKGERDLNYRRTAAFELASIEDDKLINALSGHTHNYSPELIVKYLVRFGKSKEWAMICAFEFKFWEAVKMMIQPIVGKTSKEELEAVQKKAVVSEQLDIDIRRLESYMKIFFGEDDVLMKKKRSITPELVANKS